VRKNAGLWEVEEAFVFLGEFPTHVVQVRTAGVGVG
jgi:hypothetical protein